jgi:DNA-directed RNA polymerase specialized sigma24 family protein
MSLDNSVSAWIERLKAGEPAAVGPLWERYYQRLVELARQRLRGLRTAAADAEDVALSAFDSFCRAAGQGRFPRLEDRDDLWQILLVLTARKAVNLVKHEHAPKRGGGRLVHASTLAAQADAEELAHVLGREPTPELAAQAAEEFRRLLDGLPEPLLRRLALARMEGYSVADIARQTGKSVATVERKLQRIRLLWEVEILDQAQEV